LCSSRQKAPLYKLGLLLFFFLCYSASDLAPGLPALGLHDALVRARVLLSRFLDRERRDVVGECDLDPVLGLVDFFAVVEELELGLVARSELDVKPRGGVVRLFNANIYCSTASISTISSVLL
jgi:hypothetical protein